jgi:hypothetical protein
MSLAAIVSPSRMKETTTNSPTMARLLVSQFNQNTESQTLSLWRSLPQEDKDQTQVSKS